MPHSRVGLGVKKGERGISPQGERGISWGESLHLCAVRMQAPSGSSIRLQAV